MACPHVVGTAVAGGGGGVLATAAALRRLTRRPTAEEQLRRLERGEGVKGVKSLLISQGVDIRGCVEKAELLSKAGELLAREEAAGVESQARDLSRVRRDIAAALRAPQSHDDGSYAPLLIRFAWHCCGTFDKATGTGGSNGSTMRFPAEQADPENAGLGLARKILLGVHRKHPWMSLADLHVLGGYVAIEEAGGPPIPFACGRLDFTEEEAAEVYGTSRCPFGDGQHNPAGSRLPAADLGADKSCPKRADDATREAATIAAMRGTFGRMGFGDRETVALILLGHQFGRCHPEHSGYAGSWYGFDPAHWNIYGPGGLGYLTVYSHLGDFKEEKSPTGKRQWNNMRFGGDRGNPAFMMLAVDMALGWDPEYRKHVAWYNSHRLEFRRDAAVAWKKLTELGCPTEMLVPEHKAVPLCTCEGRTPCKACRPSVR